MPPKRSLRSVPSKNRRKPFSHKQKKLQLQQKRQRKGDRRDVGTPPTVSAEDGGDERGEGSSTETGSEGEAVATVEVARLNLQPATADTDTHYDPNRYKLHFQRESAEEIERRKLRAQTQPLAPVPESEMEVSVEDIYRPGSDLDIPRRPPWSYSMTKEQLDQQEQSAFQDYLSRIHSNHRPQDLSLFEHNLETWRQLWRVLEISDVVLFITDVRHPALHFSPALYSHVVEDLRKKLVLVLNKVDLVPPEVAVAWRHYFVSKFPQLHVVCFTCFPSHHPSSTPSSPHPHPSSGRVSLRPRKRVGGTLPSAVGSRELFEVVEEMFAGKVDLSGWRQRLEGGGGGGEGGEGRKGGGGGDSGVDNTDSDSEKESGKTGKRQAEVEENDAAKVQSDSTGIVTIGMVGHPNVGKSSILNGLVGKKKVSTSRTPGHTKHFQTIFLSRSVRLCDCPGLVFPSLVNRQLQIMSGMYPVAQVREPYTPVGYLAERTPLTSLLGLVEEEGEEGWTAWGVCEG
ncbi:Guanine nucleotide-binding protein-like 1 [Geodia barretti]|uniref:Guanine nucleotide-binding protein-like 1 n=1 Tax=Geodia barretti TaxID=519541 RepID=A0AA35X471_GEOBA|nr:Guanine nucleotide-binding protein-like 1 [Geodia barretti]